MFDPGVPYGFDEDMWERRLRAPAGAIVYVARAGPGPSPRPRGRPAAPARPRGLPAGVGLRALRRAPRRRAGVLGELRVLAGCVFHIFRYRCGTGSC